jgi:hypothetical protein
MKNVHQRLLDHPIEAVRPWIALAWSGTDRDVFPRDRIPTWRKNPERSQGSELVPDVTRLGHGPFVFTLRQWDGSRWRVDFGGGRGWHGFDLEELGGQTRITHTLSADVGVAFRLLVLPIHDWAVESMFDRLEVALATGAVPARTERGMGLLAATAWETRRLARDITRRWRRRPAALPSGG